MAKKYTKLSGVKKGEFVVYDQTFPDKRALENMRGNLNRWHPENTYHCEGLRLRGYGKVKI